MSHHSQRRQLLSQTIATIERSSSQRVANDIAHRDVVVSRRVEVVKANVFQDQEDSLVSSVHDQDQRSLRCAIVVMRDHDDAKKKANDSKNATNVVNASHRQNRDVRQQRVQDATIN